MPAAPRRSSISLAPVSPNVRSRVIFTEQAHAVKPCDGPDCFQPTWAGNGAQVYVSRNPITGAQGPFPVPCPNIPVGSGWGLGYTASDTSDNFLIQVKSANSTTDLNHSGSSRLLGVSIAGWIDVPSPPVGYVAKYNASVASNFNYYRGDVGLWNSFADIDTVQNWRLRCGSGLQPFTGAGDLPGYSSSPVGFFSSKGKGGAAESIYSFGFRGCPVSHGMKNVSALICIWSRQGGDLKYSTWRSTVVSPGVPIFPRYFTGAALPGDGFWTTISSMPWVPVSGCKVLSSSDVDISSLMRHLHRFVFPSTTVAAPSAVLGIPGIEFLYHPWGVASVFNGPPNTPVLPQNMIPMHTSDRDSSNLESSGGTQGRGHAWIPN